METLSGELRNLLAATIKKARRAGEAGGRKALGMLVVGDARSHESMSAHERELRRRLRAHGRQLGDRRNPETGAQQIDRLAREVAYEHWHRMLFARFLAENDLLIEPESGVAVSLDECEELAREQEQDRWTVAGQFAERMLPQIFRNADPALKVRLTPETRQELERLLESLPPAVFAARDSLGWTYQFWQAERKEAVNKSGVKIGADELPAVTQLFTERYMVLFLLHNTIGAWRAGRILAANTELADTAVSEEELRRAVRLESHGSYDFEYLRFVREPRDGDEADQPAGPWRPAAGAFADWPRTTATLRVLDPCCGSGHFLVECLDLLVRLRMEEERLAPAEAVETVLRDNLFGLEIDPRCTQIAAFNLALAAWTWPGAGGYRPLPALNLASSGSAPNATRDEWISLSDEAADAGGLPAKRDVLGVENTLMSAPLRNSLGALHDLFVQAPVLGSLVDPRTVEADLYQHDYESTRALLGDLLEKEGASDEQTERAVAAQGMARAAELLAGRYHLVITNVPYLARGKQSDELKQFAQDRHPAAKADLATLFVTRGFGWLDKHGVQALVTPQNWLFLTSYRKLREDLLKRRTWNLIARLGEHAFEDPQAAGAFAAMAVLSADRPQRSWRMAGIDVSEFRTAAEKSRQLFVAQISRIEQVRQLGNPDVRVTFYDASLLPRLDECCVSIEGLTTGDLERFVQKFWEGVPSENWEPYIQNADRNRHYGARTDRIRWENGKGALRSFPTAHNFPGEIMNGKRVLGRAGLRITQMRKLPVTMYTGEIFGKNGATVVPDDASHLPAIWCFCSSPEYNDAVRKIDQTLKVTNATLAKVPFDLDRWVAVARREYPRGLPEPYTDDPTQWIFHGHPCGSVVWDDDAKRTTHGPLGIDATVLHVAVARLLGYRWPAENDLEMRLAEEMRAWVDRCQDLAECADADGIVCLAPAGGEPAAADRLRQLLAAAYGADWSAAVERRLLAAAAGEARPAESLEAWLRDRFFDEHCRLFHQRPFIWHVWDGRRDGFHALVNYHRLAGPDGGARRTLQALAYSHLGDWTARQQADRDRGIEGADGRLAAALDLKNQLEAILVGEPPCDLFVRWKPLADQSIGWEPDINDGVRVNIRPLMSAELSSGGILRAKPQIAWKKDRGKEALKPGKRWKPPWVDDDDHDTEVDEDTELRPREHYPWFWDCPGDGTPAERTDFAGGAAFDGNRWNDLHYTNAAKHAARARVRANTRATSRHPSGYGADEEQA